MLRSKTSNDWPPERERERERERDVYGVFPNSKRRRQPTDYCIGYDIDIYD
jgi:hypothetical protein